MTSKNYSLSELKTLLSNTHDEIHHILLSQSSHNNQQYYENFALISMRTFKYINHYLNRINFDHHIGGIIDSIIAALKQSLQDYKGRNVFTSSCIVSPFHEENNEAEEEDQIYHFMNTRNNSIPLQCLGNPDIERQRMELAEFVESMEKKKTILKESKRSLELPLDMSKKIKTFRKATYDPSLIPIKEEQNNVHSYEKLPVIPSYDSRPSEEEAETQTEFNTVDMEKSIEKLTQKQEDESKSQAESAFVSEVRESKIQSDKKEELENKQSKGIVDKKKSNKKFQGKGKKKKKAKIIVDVGFYTREGSRKGINIPGQTSNISKECSLKLLKNLSSSYNLSISSREVQMAISNAQQINVSLTYICKKGSEASSQTDILTFQEREEKDNHSHIVESRTVPLKFDQLDVTKSKMMDNIKETEQDILEEELLLRCAKAEAELKEEHKRDGSEGPESKRSKFNGSFIRKQVEILQQPIPVSNIQYRGDTSENSHENGVNQIHKRNFTNKRLTLLNVKLGNISQGFEGEQTAPIRKSNLFMNTQTNQLRHPQQEVIRISCAREHQKDEAEAIQYLIEQGQRFSSTHSSKKVEDASTWEERDMIMKTFEKLDKQNIEESQLIPKHKKTESLNPSKQMRSQFYATSDGFGKYLGGNLQGKMSDNQNRVSSNSSQPMIKIFTQQMHQMKPMIKDSSQQSSDHVINLQNQRLKIERKGNFLSPVSEKEAQKLNQMLADRTKTSILNRKSMIKERQLSKEREYINIKSQNQDSSLQRISQYSPQRRMHNSQSNHIIKTSMSKIHPLKSTIATAKQTLKTETVNFEKKNKRFVQSLHTSVQNENIRELARQLRQKNRKEVLNQYLELIELTHHKFCGQKCKHMEHLFKKTGFNEDKLDENVIEQLLRVLKKSK